MTSRPAEGGAGRQAEWLQPREHQRDWVGCSPGKSWSRSVERRDDSDPFQWVLGLHPCPAELNLRQRQTKHLALNFFYVLRKIISATFKYLG